MMLLFTYRWRAEGKSLINWLITVSLVTCGAFMLFVSFINVDEIAQLFGEWLAKAPPALRNLMGGQLVVAEPAAFVSQIILQTILPGLILVYVCLSVAAIYTRDANEGNLEFLLSLPIKRYRVLAGRLLVFLVSLALLHVAIFASANFGLFICGKSANAARIALILLNQYLLFVCIGGLAFLISLASKDYSKILLITLACFFGLYSMNVFMDTNQDFASVINPFYYYNATEIYSTGLVPWRNFLVLTASSLFFWVSGIWIFSRKQIT